MTRRNSLWVDWVFRYYVRALTFWNARRMSKWSWVLNNVMDLREDIRRFIPVRIGDGCSTNAWDDTWLSDVPFSLVVSY